ncbi:MAG: hypothetical protein Kow0062_19360 [Acidobacteriota bacterium]
MTLDQIAQLSTAIAAAVGALGLVVGVVIYRRQMNAQVFLEYTKRYEEVMRSFPREGRLARLSSEGEPPPPSDDLTLAVLRYLNLCSEEFYLCRKRYLSRGVWRIWEDELKRTLRTPLLRREWAQLRREFEAYPEFAEYVDRVQKTA